MEMAFWTVVFQEEVKWKRTAWGKRGQKGVFDQKKLHEV